MKESDCHIVRVLVHRVCTDFIILICHDADGHICDTVLYGTVLFCSNNYFFVYCSNEGV